MALNIGDRLGHYDVTALIGEGGMGQVYRATDTQLYRTANHLSRGGMSPDFRFGCSTVSLEPVAAP